MKHVLAATILHEANSFARTPAPISHFERQGIFLGAAAQARFSQTRTEMAGFLAAARTCGWRLTTPIVVPCAPAGPMSMEAFILFRDTLLDGVRTAGALDGVLLALHGANAVDGEPDPDSAITTAMQQPEWHRQQHSRLCSNPDHPGRLHAPAGLTAIRPGARRSA